MTVYIPLESKACVCLNSYHKQSKLQRINLVHCQLQNSEWPCSWERQEGIHNTTVNYNKYLLSMSVWSFARQSWVGFLSCICHSPQRNRLPLSCALLLRIDGATSIAVCYEYCSRCYCYEYSWYTSTAATSIATRRVFLGCWQPPGWSHFYPGYMNIRACVRYQYSF